MLKVTAPNYEKEVEIKKLEKTEKKLKAFKD